MCEITNFQNGNHPCVKITEGQPESKTTAKYLNRFLNIMIGVNNYKQIAILFIFKTSSNKESSSKMSDEIYLTITGEQQGCISSRCGTSASIGNRWQIGHEDEIFAFSLSNSITNTGKGS